MNQPGLLLRVRFFGGDEGQTAIYAPRQSSGNPTTNAIRNMLVTTSHDFSVRGKKFWRLKAISKRRKSPSYFFQSHRRPNGQGAQHLCGRERRRAAAHETASANKPSSCVLSLGSVCRFSRGVLPEIGRFSSMGVARRTPSVPLRRAGVRGAKSKARSAVFASQAAFPSSLEFFPR